MITLIHIQVAPPFKVTEFEILFSSGIDKYGCLLDAAELLGVVEKRGSWYSKGELRFSQGRRAAIEYLKEDIQLATAIEQEVRVLMRQKDPSMPMEIPENVIDEEPISEGDPMFE